MAIENGILDGPLEKEFVISRVFEAPRKLVFKAWTEPDCLAHWWGPKGFRMHVSNLNLQPGGVFHYCLQSEEGYQMWGRFVYSEIDAPKRIVFTSSFSDKEGTVTRAPFSQTWPLEVFNTLTLTEHEGKTLLTLRVGPINATEKEAKTFEGRFSSLQLGFTGTFDHLAHYLANDGNGTDNP